ncbi:MAG: signal peptidase I [Gammaproteobacteria bacterium]|nr:MAG: signal peptidase I [Gammaproteobacteria bacterium]
MSMDFALIMFIGLLLTGGIWLADKLWGEPSRQARAAKLRQSGEASSAMLEKVNREPMIVEYAKAFFPVILVVFLLRSFLMEPFRIPSGSMLPTLKIGDFILVNKFAYGLRLPIANVKIIETGEPERGDVMVFRFPNDPSVNYIKRVVGLPGDEIEYKNKTLYINGKKMPRTSSNENYQIFEAGSRFVTTQQFDENLDGVVHKVLLDPTRSQANLKFQKVPEGHYFVMGDNRDYSNDSRYWGFVPEKNVVGKAILVWFSWDVGNGKSVKWDRIGSRIQ